MNHVDDIHQLLDGELSDDSMAELLHRLSVDPEKRAMFRQQIVLQNALHHNESFSGIGVSDDWAVLENIAREVGLDGATPQIRRGPGAIAIVGALLLGLVAGTGAGYGVGHVAAADFAASHPDTVRVVERVEVPVTRPSYAFDDVLKGINTRAADAVHAAKAAGSSVPTHYRSRRSSNRTDVTGYKEAHQKK